MQCFNCWAFGHTKTRCKAEQSVCGKCSGTHEIPEDRSCSFGKYCSTCDTAEHSIQARTCPVYKQENDIQRIRVDQGVSYPVAKRLYEQGRSNHSFAKVVSAGTDEAIAEMNRRLSEKDQEIAELRASLNARATVMPSSSQDEVVRQLQAIVTSQAEQIKSLSENVAILTKQISCFLGMSSTEQAPRAQPTVTPIDQSDLADYPADDTSASDPLALSSETLTDIFTDSSSSVSPNGSPNSSILKSQHHDTPIPTRKKTPVKDTPRLNTTPIPKDPTSISAASIAVISNQHSINKRKSDAPLHPRRAKK